MKLEMETISKGEQLRQQRMFFTVLPKHLISVASSTVFIFTLRPLKQFLTFHLQLREKLLNPILNVGKKKKKTALND